MRTPNWWPTSTLTPKELPVAGQPQQTSYLPPLDPGNHASNPRPSWLQAFQPPKNSRTNSMAFVKSPQSRPTTLHNLHNVSTSLASWTPATSIRDELLQHSRYIRDYLSPLLADQPSLPATEIELLRSIMTRISSIPITIELLRYSRIEKALLLIAFTSPQCWPADVTAPAERTLKRWENELGQSMKNVRQDFFSPGGRLAGLKPHELFIGEPEVQVIPLPDIYLQQQNTESIAQDTHTHRTKYAASPTQPPSAFSHGHSGFSVGS